ncbi:TPA: DEAD/DEAH box helicase [Candidatus Woesearchaeota archaeon]|nr:DEAD/DEAH box helicase [Candidatus Woesearchaeota archaeon]
MNFKELHVKDEIVRALHEIGIDEPTSIQVKAIPVIVEGKDLVGISKTGSGKTAAFGIPMLEMLTSARTIQALVLAPTRELAVQIAGELHKFGKYIRPTIAAIYGGVSLQPQIDQLERSTIVVGTPGRIKDHIQRGNIDFSSIRQVVLDEADKMVEMGFIEDIRFILDTTPANRQMVLFGATLSREIDLLKRDYMRHPVVAEAEGHVEEQYLQQFYYNVSPQEKFSLLIHLLKKETVGMGIIFCSSRQTVEVVTRNLHAQGIRAMMIHGKLSQNKRLQVMKEFNEGKISLLVASSVAARGLHIDGVTHVFNYDLSQDPQEYVHRIGRTARAGESGKAITLLGPRDHDVFRDILRRYPVTIQELPHEDFPRVLFNARSEDRDHPRDGRFSRPRSGFGGGTHRSSYGHSSSTDQRSDRPRSSGAHGSRGPGSHSRSLSRDTGSGGGWRKGY